MAKLKFAFQAEYYKTHRRQLRDYMFGNFHTAAGLASAIAPVANAMMDISIMKNLLAATLGITAKRPFPKFSSARAMVRIAPGNDRRKVIFLSDAFSKYIEPAVEQAAFDILTTCGYDVHVLPVVGAGATFLSKGFVVEARQHARRVLDALYKIDPMNEVPVVGIEPPEIYCLKHDYLDLLASMEKEIRARIDKVWFLDEFLLRSDDFHDVRVGTSGGAIDEKKNLPTKTVHFHPHCHQRAEGPADDGAASGTNATLQLLNSCGYDVELMDTGCCGMAGTFGYEAEHYELSMKVGELKLFPQLRAWKAANDGSLIASTGAACRMQIEQGTGVKAFHPLLLIAQSLNAG
jgi:Fe-S oxidoreductase